MHIYDGEPALIASELALSAAAVKPAAIALGEVGFSTTPGIGDAADVPDTTQSLEAFQSVFVRSAALAAMTMDIPMTVWTWSDFRSDAIPPELQVAHVPQEYGFGLVDVRGTSKPALTALAAAFRTGRVDSTLNFGFEAGDSQSDFPLDWRMFDPQDGRGMWDTTVAHTGQASVRFSGTRGSGAPAPSVFITPIVPIVPGDGYRLDVWAQGRNLTGYTVASISWYTAQAIYLGQRTSAQLPAGDTPWTQLGVVAQAPAAAAFVQLHLKSAENSGSAWFDDVSFVPLS